MNKLQKLVTVSGVVIISVLTGFLFSRYDVVPDEVEGIFGAGLPDVGQRFSTAASASKEATIKGASSRLFACKVRNEGLNANSYFQLFDRATEPNFDSVPLYSFAIPASTTSDGWLDLPNTFFSPALQFSTGLTFGISSDDDTYSSASIDEINYDVFCQYE
mgnify:CR=1 FL=1